MASSRKGVGRRVLFEGSRPFMGRRLIQLAVRDFLANRRGQRCSRRIYLVAALAFAGI